jgi:hypothetical protein
LARAEPPKPALSHSQVLPFTDETPVFRFPLIGVFWVIETFEMMRMNLCGGWG